jgi:GGDEF domain-containing protein
VLVVAGMLALACAAIVAIGRLQVEVPFKLTTGALWEILRLVSKDRSDQANEASDLAARQAAKADLALQRAAEHDRGRSVQSLRHARIGSAAVILLLFLAFAWFYLRALRARRTAETLAAENRRLLAASQAEALTDPLTGLGNRRALMADLEARPEPAEGEQTLLALFDLDGFKHYNDTFGHPAGDAVLELLGGRLADAVTSCGSAYRMGGDEFCVVASVQEDARRGCGDPGRLRADRERRRVLDRHFIRHGPDARGSRDRERRAAAGGPAHVRPQARRQGSRRQGLERSLERRRGG